jgi:hypothetical protein
VDTLIETLQAFGREMDEKLKNEKEIVIIIIRLFKFDSLLGDHTSKILALESLVNQADLDINREKKRLNTELGPRSEDLDEVKINIVIVRL